eukprot:scaffold133664_cov20-Tisochrysis_lutea.AAC.4
MSEFEQFYVINAYVPNSGEGLKRLDYRVGDGGCVKVCACKHKCVCVGEEDVLSTSSTKARGAFEVYSLNHKMACFV